MTRGEKKWRDSSVETQAPHCDKPKSTPAQTASVYAQRPHSLRELASDRLPRTPCFSDVGVRGAFRPIWDLLPGELSIYSGTSSGHGVCQEHKTPWEIQWRGIMSSNCTHKTQPTHTQTHRNTHRQIYIYSPVHTTTSHVGEKYPVLGAMTPRKPLTKADLQLVKPGSISTQSICLVICTLILRTSVSLQEHHL